MAKLRKFSRVVPWLVAGQWYLPACTTAEIAPAGPPVPPVYMNVPHPVGSDVGDLMAIASDPSAPKDPNFEKTCDSDYLKLKSKTQSLVEIKDGINELVQQDPVAYHWCFYNKLLSLENMLKGESYLDEKQKSIIQVYEFLVPVAKSFEVSYRDSRYMRWAISRYQHFSAWIFYRRLALTPAGTMELVQPENPFGLYRNPTATSSILNKYNLVKPEPAVTPSEMPRTPAPPETAPVTSVETAPSSLSSPKN